MLLHLAIVGIALLVGAWGSNRLVHGTIASNRAVEWPENEKSEPLARPLFEWTIVHIRDDVGCIQNLLWLANMLLAGILGALVAHLI